MSDLNFKSKKVLGFGEIMLRITPPNNQKIMQANTFEAVYSGGEANVIASLAILGHDTKFITKLPDNYLGKKVLSKFRGYNVDVSDVILGEGRLGVYYAEIGHGIRSTEVIYDRKYSAISLAEEDEFNVDQMLEGVGLIHLSGITPALSQNLKKLILKLVKTAKEKGVLVSYDSNFRSKLWSLEKAREVLKQVLPYVDFAFLGYLDMINILEYSTFQKDYNLALEDLYRKLFDNYPNLKYAASTRRIVNSINNNTLEGFLFDGRELYKSNAYTFDILDRVGGGDAYTAGILHGILKGYTNPRIVEFGTCASSMKHSIPGDINLVDEETINSYIDEGLCNVKR